ncbi:hypothetical protein LPN01_11180 [Sphingomonas sp. A2-49]|uniref:hypothetical protein n=1 Tax=Sphingomonas sp. A2-49 TaxID=1391375 RepID=UPI0021D25271|nr:hypothetical protein [Sphingomonas sp. A2-49]MCU6454640.1 hypothetical protein [Sphingomonas sp. A2-49]
MSHWAWLGLAATAYCLIRGVVDLRRRSYGWGVAGLASGIVMLMIPNPNDVVTVTLPIAGASR